MVITVLEEGSVRCDGTIMRWPRARQADEWTNASIDRQRHRHTGRGKHAHTHIESFGARKGRAIEPLDIRSDHGDYRWLALSRVHRSVASCKQTSPRPRPRHAGFHRPPQSAADRQTPISTQCRQEAGAVCKLARPRCSLVLPPAPTLGASRLPLLTTPLPETSCASR